MNKADLPFIRTRLGLRRIAMFVLTLLAMALAIASPALGQTSQELGQESESGDVDATSDVASGGDYAQQCAAPLQFGNTGSLQNAQGFFVATPSDAQYSPRIVIDDVDFEGSSFEFAPEVGLTCDQAVQQAAAASSDSSSDGCSWTWDGGWWCLWSDGSWWLWDDGSWTSWDTGWWYPAASDGWWYWDSSGWWWWDGYSWGYYGWSPVSKVATGALDATRGSLPLLTLGALALIGTASIAFRRNWRRD